MLYCPTATKMALSMMVASSLWLFNWLACSRRAKNAASESIWVVCECAPAVDGVKYWSELVGGWHPPRSVLLQDRFLAADRLPSQWCAAALRKRCVLAGDILRLEGETETGAGMQCTKIYNADCNVRLWSARHARKCTAKNIYNHLHVTEYKKWFFKIVNGIWHLV